MELIRELEGMDRGRYSGPVGWVDARGNGEWGIALRCGLVAGRNARLFSGSGPVYGGTLKLIAASGPDHIDTVPAYYTADYILERGYARQLLTYPTVPDPSLTSPGWTKDITPAPDVATAIPTTSNGGITNGGKTYTFHIKQGVDRNTKPRPQGTPAEFNRGIKAVCKPLRPGREPR